MLVTGLESGEVSAVLFEDLLDGPGRGEALGVTGGSELVFVGHGAAVIVVGWVEVISKKS